MAGRRPVGQRDTGLARTAHRGGNLDWVSTTSGAGYRGPFAELPFAEIFDAQGEDDGALGVDVLASFAGMLHDREATDWSTGRVHPAEAIWAFTTIGSYDQPSDWTEVPVYVRSWATRVGKEPGPSQRLWRVWLSLEVACWCLPDHNIHRIHEVTLEAGAPEGLRRTCAAALMVVDGWLSEGLLPADMWRERAGLPLRGTA